MGSVVRRTGLVVLVASGLAAAVSWAGPGDTTKSSAAERSWRSVPALTTAELVATLHQINRMEIDAGKMAQDKGASQAVRDLGQTLERDHQAADDQLKDYAGKNKLNVDAAVPSSVSTDLQRTEEEMDHLQKVSGAVFDRQFATDMVRDHEKAIGIVSKARAGAADPQLQTLLGDLEPQLREHQQLARNVLGGGPRASASGL